jgi:hypothetical protein
MIACLPPESVQRFGELPWERSFPHLGSLADMIPLYLTEIVRAAESLKDAHGSADLACHARGDRAPFPREETPGEFHAASAMKQMAIRFGFGRLRDGLSHYQNVLRGQPTYGDVRSLSGEALRRLYEDLQMRQFGFVDAAKSDVLTKMDSEWFTVWQAFPSAQEHARDGVSAYAVDLGTACVFHMMIVLERGLASLAHAVKAKRKKEWGKIIEAIEEAISGMNKAKAGKALPPRRAAKRAAKLTFYAIAAKEFTYFKEAWRNHTAHGRARYGEDDAHKIMVHVREFMFQLAAHGLKERPLP